MDSRIDFSQAISLLSVMDRAILHDLHETALSLGYSAKIASAGKKPGNWKCEYIAAKPKRTLYILHIEGASYFIRAKLFHLPEYIGVLESCTERCKASFLADSKGCGKHGGGCAGPVDFTLEGKSYSKCRHFLSFSGLAPDDMDGIRRLLQNEAMYSINNNM